jgi:hypothetical protein
MSSTETGAGWFSSLFGYNQTEDPTIPNYASNGVDVPMNNPDTVVLWNKYGLNLGAATTAADKSPNTTPAADQTWYQRFWAGAQSGVKFVFCPIFTDCPAPVPPGGYKVSDLGSAAGKAMGDTLKSALGPIMPILVILIVILILVNLTLSRVGVKP